MTGLLETPGSGFIIVIDSDNAVAVTDEAGCPIVFATQRAAELAILQLLLARIAECQRGEREFENTLPVPEYVHPVMVDELGVIYDEDEYEFWAPAELG